MNKASVLFKQNYISTANIVINQGGSNSGKTFAILQVLFCLACQDEKLVITVAGQDIPNLKAGALRDAYNICLSSPQLLAMIKSINKSDRLFEFKNGSYNQPVTDQKNLANTIAYQMINNFPPVYVDVKDINNQQNILAQTINRVNL